MPVWLFTAAVSWTALPETMADPLRCQVASVTAGSSLVQGMTGGIS